MSGLPQNNYTDPSGNLYSNFTSNGTVTPFGFHFKNPEATGQFVAYVIWLACFTSFVIGICWTRHRDKGKPAGTSASYKYLRWPVMGFSTICMVLIYTMQVYNRIVHEIEESIRWYYPAVIGVLVNVLSGTAQGLLIAFLLWQLTPILLLYGKVTENRTKWTIRLCRFLTWFINLVNTADTVVTAMLWVLEVRKQYFKVKIDKTEAEVTSISTINDAALTAAFTGMFLICVLIFAAVARLALKHLSEAKKRFKTLLFLLTAAMILRSALDFAWAIVFKVFALRGKLKYDETLTTNLIRTVLYGFFSVVIYGSIVGIAMLPLPEGVDHDQIAVQYLPKKAKLWHNRLSMRGAGLRAVPTAQPVYQQVPATPEIGKGGYATGAVEELMPQKDAYYGYGYAGDSYASTSMEEMNQKRFRGGMEYQPPGVQSRF